MPTESLVVLTVLAAAGLVLWLFTLAVNKPRAIVCPACKNRVVPEPGLFGGPSCPACAIEWDQDDLESMRDDDAANG